MVNDQDDSALAIWLDNHADEETQMRAIQADNMQAPRSGLMVCCECQTRSLGEIHVRKLDATVAAQ